MYKIIDGQVTFAVLKLKGVEKFGNAVIYQTVEDVLQVDFIESFVFLCVIESKRYLLGLAGGIVFGEQEDLQEVIEFNKIECMVVHEFENDVDSFRVNREKQLIAVLDSEVNLQVFDYEIN
jgi:hypothetical protein